MISKELFIETINAVNRQAKKEDEFSDAIEKISSGIFISEFSTDLNVAIFNLLKSIFNDESDWIGWWCYEKEMGTREDLKCYDENEVEIKIDTVEELYDFLIKNMK